MTPGPIEILVILFVLAMIVGPSRITRLAKSLGRGAYDFIDELGGDKKDADDGNQEELESGDEKKDSRD